MFFSFASIEHGNVIHFPPNKIWDDDHKPILTFHEFSVVLGGSRWFGSGSQEVLESLSLDSGIAQTASVAGVRDAVVVRRDAICSVQAVAAPSSWGPLATLPSECRPSATLVFKLPTLSAVAEVDVTGQGVISCWDSGNKLWGVSEKNDEK